MKCIPIAEKVNTIRNTMNQPILSPSKFSDKAPIIHVDYSRQHEVIQTVSKIIYRV